MDIHFGLLRPPTADEAGPVLMRHIYWIIQYFSLGIARYCVGDYAVN